jgi:hypothetical protein
MQVLKPGVPFGAHLCIIWLHPDYNFIMDQTDAFFTQTVVGAPFTALMGRRRTPGQANAEGLDISMASGETRLTRLWQDWIVLSHACDPVGVARVRPGRFRRLLERHALWVAVLGLGSLLVSAIFWGVTLWT